MCGTTHLTISTCFDDDIVFFTRHCHQLFQSFYSPTCVALLFWHANFAQKNLLGCVNVEKEMNWGMFTFLNYDRINKSKVNGKVNYPNKSTLSMIILFLKPGFISQANI